MDHRGRPGGVGGVFCSPSDESAAIGILGLDGPDYSSLKLTNPAPDAGDSVLAILRHALTWRMGWLERWTLSPVLLFFGPFLAKLDAAGSVHAK